MHECTLYSGVHYRIALKWPFNLINDTHPYSVFLPYFYMDQTLKVCSKHFTIHNIKHLLKVATTSIEFEKEIILTNVEYLCPNF